MSTDDDKAWQRVINEAVAREVLIPVGLNSEGKMVYRVCHPQGGPDSDLTRTLEQPAAPIERWRR